MKPNDGKPGETGRRELPTLGASDPRGWTRVLVVENDLNTRDALAMLLRDERYWVETISGGPDVIEALRWFRPHVAVIDLGSSIVGAGNLLNIVREVAPHTQVVVTASFVDDDGPRAIRERGASSLSKPIDVRHLSSTIYDAACHSWGKVGLGESVVG